MNIYTRKSLRAILDSLSITKIGVEENMNIEIGKYLIPTDKYNFIVNEKYEKRSGGIGKHGKPTGEFAYKEISYHGSIESALRKLLTLDLVNESIPNIDSLLTTIRMHRKELEELYSRLSSVIGGNQNERD